MTLTQANSLVLTVALSLLSACTGDSARIEELERELAEIREEVSQTSTLPETTTTTEPTTTTTTIPELTPAQQVYCADLVTVIAVPTTTGGRTARPETVEFFELAHQMGYLQLPYNPSHWGNAVAETPRDFVSFAHLFAGAMALDVGGALVVEWASNLASQGTTSVDTVYQEVCLQAWELR